MAEINVQDYGAEGDGSKDDTDAIRSAIGELTDGDTLYFPEPEVSYLVSDPGADAIFNIDANDASELTIEGDGQGTIIEKDGGHETGGTHVFLIHDGGGDISGNINNIEIVGNPEENTDTDRGPAIEIRNNSSTVLNEFIIEDVKVSDYNGIGIDIKSQGCTVRNCTVDRAWGHGIGVGSIGSAGGDVIVENCHSINVGERSGGTWYGIDWSDGDGIARDCVIENAGQSMKCSEADEEYNVTFRRIRAIGDSETGHAFITTGDLSSDTTMEFDDVVFTNHGNMFYGRGEDNGEDESIISMPDDSTLVVDGIRNDDNNSWIGGVTVNWGTRLHASNATICVNDTVDGHGLRADEMGSNSQLGTLYHAGNDDGAVNNDDSLDIGEITEQRVEDIDGVPHAEDVGAWSTTEETSETEVSTEEATNITTDSATLNGNLDSISDDTSDVDVYFEWGEQGTGLTETTNVQNLTTTGSFSEDITGLSDETIYEFRAVGYDGTEQVYGDTLTFSIGLDTFSTDFTGQVTGEFPDNWTTQWDSQESQWSVIESGKISSKSLHFEAAESSRRALSWDTPGTVSDSEMLGLMRIPAYTENQSWCRLYLRGGGTLGDEDGYYTAIRYDADGNTYRFSFEIYVGNDYSRPYAEDISYGAGDWIWVRFRADGDQLQGKYWGHGEEEPSSWSFDIQDSNLSSGWAGVGSFPWDSQEWDYVSLGVDGAPAPMPGEDEDEIIESNTLYTEDGVRKTVFYNVLTGEPVVTVMTNGVNTVSSSEISLDGELTELERYREADLYFQYKRNVDSEWDDTNIVESSAIEPQSFSTTIDGLEAETEYDGRAVVYTHGDVEVGSVMSAITESSVELLIVDDFEQYDDTTTILDNYDETDGSTPEVVDESTVAHSAISGTQMLEHSGSGMRIVSTPGDGLDNYFGKGETIKYYVYEQNQEDTNTQIRNHFGLENTSNYYDIRLAFTTSETDDPFAMYSVGGANYLDSYGPDILPREEWLEIEIDWGSDDVITATLTRDAGNGETIATLSATNNDHETSEGIAWRYWSGDNAVNWDFAHKPQ